MKLIPLDAVLAEIERLENQNYKNSNDFNLGAATYLGILKHFINSLEVTEVAKITEYDIKIYINNKAQKKENSYDK